MSFWYFVQEFTLTYWTYQIDQKRKKVFKMFFLNLHVYNQHIKFIKKEKSFQKIIFEFSDSKKSEITNFQSLQKNWDWIFKKSFLTQSDPGTKWKKFYISIWSDSFSGYRELPFVETNSFFWCVNHAQATSGFYCRTGKNKIYKIGWKLQPDRPSHFWISPLQIWKKKNV